MKLVYIAGPFRGANHFEIAENIRAAERVALSVWQTPGYAAVCPHLNTAHFQGAAPDEVWLKGDLEILRRCDAVLLVPGWERSAGTREEVIYAAKKNIHTFDRLDHLVEYFRDNPESNTNKQ